MFHQGGDRNSFHDDHSLPLDGALSASLYEAADFLLREAAPLIKDHDSNLERPCSSCLASSCVCTNASLPHMPSTSATASKCSICQGTTDFPALRMAHEIICLSMAFCHQCCVTFTSDLAKELHLVREHNTYPCLDCEESFSSELKLANHLAKEHGIVRCPCCDQHVC